MFRHRPWQNAGDDFVFALLPTVPPQCVIAKPVTDVTGVAIRNPCFLRHSIVKQCVGADAYIGPSHRTTCNVSLRSQCAHWLWQSASPVPTASLPKGGWHGEAVTGGFFPTRTHRKHEVLYHARNPSTNLRLVPLPLAKGGFVLPANPHHSSSKENLP